jgi:hypothetical protein
MRQLKITGVILALAIIAVVYGSILAPGTVISLVEYLGKERLLKHLKQEKFSGGNVYLERYFHPRDPLQSVRLDNGSFRRWLEVLPKSGNVPSTSSKCWDPHHRIRIVHGNAETQLKICFTCDEFWTDYSGRRKIPSDWQDIFRELFRSEGISDKAPEREEVMRHQIQIEQSNIEEGEKDRNSSPAPAIKVGG